ncbi:MAG: T9SS type A sorting domain-containing protein [Cryomorphaceae bacterium]|nr:T9SS type A sorting domain-containing protein [Cryomorphaceae bacterium]
MRYLILNIVVVILLFLHQVNAQITDIDGNVYPTVIIGTQEWMAENLRTSRLRNGVEIPNITNARHWTDTLVPAFCWYNNDSATHHVPYGKMYNGYAALDTLICPPGWYVPTTANWDQMVQELGGTAVAGGKLKQAGFQHWDQPNTGADNSSGFTALPIGFRSNVDGTFNFKGARAGWFVRSGQRDVEFRWVSWSLASAGSGPMAPNAGLAIRCFRNLRISVPDNPSPEIIEVYPNPSKGVFQIRLPNDQKTTEVRVHNLEGKMVFQTQTNDKSVLEIDLGNLSAGNYVLEIISEGNSVIKRLILN